VGVCLAVLFVVGCFTIPDLIWPPFAKYRDIKLRDGMSEAEIVGQLGQPADTECPSPLSPTDAGQEWGLDKQVIADEWWWKVGAMRVRPAEGADDSPPWKVTRYSRIEQGGRSGAQGSYQPRATAVRYRVNLLFLRGELYRWRKEAEAAD
jgi:hypothetical protein